jgi:hypothetical protein
LPAADVPLVLGARLVELSVVQDDVQERGVDREWLAIAVVNEF